MKNFWKFLVLALVMGAVAVSCGGKDDPKPTPTPTPDPDPDPGIVIDVPANANEWIYKYLSEWYLWSEDIANKTPSFSTANYETFFKSLLSTDREDGKSYSDGSHSFWSTISRKAATYSRADAVPELYLGFRVDVVAPWGPATDPRYRYQTHPLLIVTYVTPNSNAEVQGLKRGDIIGSVGGVALTWDNYSSFYMSMFRESESNVPVTRQDLGLYEISFDHYFTAEESTTYVGQPIYNTPTLKKTITVNPEQKVLSPVHMVEVITSPGGKKVGYMLYNEFQTGESDYQDTHEYDLEMLAGLKSLKDGGATEIVIDLRYNPGGAVSSCNLMSSALMPRAKMGTHFAQFKYNAKITAKYLGDQEEWTNFYTRDELLSAGGDNLDLTKVYVIATNRSASASEMVINALRGVDVNVIHVGNVTTGKRVGSTLLRGNGQSIIGGTYNSYTYEMRPIDFYIFNAKREANYGNGFTPQYYVNEYDVRLDYGWSELGTENEVMLAAVLRHIDTGSFNAPSASAPVVSRSAAAQNKTLEIQNSMPYPIQGGLVRTLDIDNIQK